MLVEFADVYSPGLKLVVPLHLWGKDRFFGTVGLGEVSSVLSLLA